MHLRFWTWSAGVIASLTSRGSCLPQDTPFPLTNSSVTANLSSANLNPPRNPCTDDQFQPPIYQFSNVSAAIRFFYPYEPGGNYYSTIKFTVTDVANNYSLRCTWGPEYQGYGHDWIGGCVPSAGPAWSRTQDVTLLSLVPDSLMKNKSSSEPVRLLQYWYCDVRNQSYPKAYQSRAAVFFNITCLDQGPREVEFPCTVLGSDPATAKSEWYGSGPLPRTPQLAPRPSPPVPAAKGLDPPPKTDCTDLSFTHPNWQLSNFSALPATGRSGERAARVNLTLTSRATGVRAECKFDEKSKNNGGQLMLDCSLQPPQPESRTVFTVSYSGNDYRTLDIQEDWVCGDTLGQYSTAFRARTPFGFAIPTYDNGAGLQVADPMNIHGQLTLRNQYWTPGAIPPPPNTKTPGCLSKSQTSPIDLWSITHFLYQRTTRSISGAYGGGLRGDGSPYPYDHTLSLSVLNTANGYTTSCSFPTSLLDAASFHLSTTWLTCPTLGSSHPQSSPHAFPRYELSTLILFDPSTGELRLNQTWFCADTQKGTPFQLSGTGSTAYGYDKLIGGSSASTAYNVVCGAQIAPLYCNVTYTAAWWALGGDREGNGAPVRVGGGMPTQVGVRRLPEGAFTEPDPGPERGGGGGDGREGRGCTVRSLGRGPVVWTLKAREYLALTAWMGHRRTDTTFTRLRFDLESSVFSNANVNVNDTTGGGGGSAGVIRNIGNQKFRHDWEEEEELVKTTPWLNTWDPGYTYRSGQRYGEGRLSYDDLGWDFYNALEWSLRFDLSTGYMELSHSWYCDDKNPDKPIIFNGTWNGYIPLQCEYKFGSDRSDYEDGIVCLPAGGDPVVTPVVTHMVLETAIPDPK